MKLDKNLFAKSGLILRNAVIMLLYSERHTPTFLLEIPDQVVLEILLEFEIFVKPVIVVCLRFLLGSSN